MSDHKLACKELKAVPVVSHKCHDHTPGEEIDPSRTDIACAFPAWSSVKSEPASNVQQLSKVPSTQSMSMLHVSGT